jgi:hypothetical protein
MSTVKNGEEGGPSRPPSSQEAEAVLEVIQVKQFLVMKMVQGLNQMAGMVALPGLYTLDAAEQFVNNAMAHEPNSMYVIQEVGAA